MALVSQLFAGDAKLEAALVSDPAHIKTGAKGDHVRKIQRALNLVDNAKLDPDGVYGPATAAAVLAYKRKRKIINPAYQTSADDIVGKMTIARLDAEVATSETLPGQLVAISPLAPPVSPRRGGLIFAFALPGDGAGGGGGGGGVVAQPSASPSMTNIVQAPVLQRIAVNPNRLMKVNALNFAGGVLVMFEPPNQNTSNRIVKLNTGTNIRTTRNLTNADIVANPEEFTLQSFFECGVVQVQATGPGPRKSAITEFLVLVEKSSYADKPVAAVDGAFKSGLVSVTGTPLNPKQGRKINIFGRGETNGFENYSTSIPFCNDSDANTKPWTDDPRKNPGPGIPDKSVMNISIRSSPIKKITIDEIKRIAAPGCRVTYSGPATDPTDIQTLRSNFLDAGLAKKPPVEDGQGAFGQTLVFEMN